MEPHPSTRSVSGTVARWRRGSMPATGNARLPGNLVLRMLDALGSAIVTGRYEHRPFPNEADITATFGVSRTVTREAVKMLTAKGLVRARPRHGTSAEPADRWNLLDPDVLQWLTDAKPSLRLLRHFDQLRAGIEPEAAALAAEFRDRNDVNRIEASLRLVEAARRSTEGALEADIAFHDAILLASNNPFYAQFRAVVAAALRASASSIVFGKDADPDASLHLAVAAAVRGRDAMAARTAMLRIIELGAEVRIAERRRRTRAMKLLDEGTDRG